MHLSQARIGLSSGMAEKDSSASQASLKNGTAVNSWSYKSDSAKYPEGVKEYNGYKTESIIEVQVDRPLAMPIIV